MCDVVSIYFLQDGISPNIVWNIILGLCDNFLFVLLLDYRCKSTNRILYQCITEPPNNPTECRNVEEEKENGDDDRKKTRETQNKIKITF